MTRSRVRRGKSKIKRLLSGSKRKIAIITHINPDGDAIGSSLALGRLLSNLGHETGIITPNVYPEFLQWMPGNDEIVIFNHGQKKVRQLIQSAEIIFCVDFNNLSRVKQINELVDQSKALKVLIDHHPTKEYFTPVVYADINASSTAELIYDFMLEHGFKKAMDKDIATCLFAGIMTDTGCFSYNSSNPHTFKVVARLLDYGIDKDEAYYNVYDNFSGNRMKLLGYILNEKMEIFVKYSTAILSLTREEQKRYRFQPGDSEGFVNYPLSIKDIRFSVLFVEKEDHIKISFRSKGNFAVNKFAEQHFNGGGHLNASGGENYASMEETLEKFRDVLLIYKEELGNE